MANRSSSLVDGLVIVDKPPGWTSHDVVARCRRVFGQRWQAESAFSRHKRRLGSALYGKSDDSRERECRLRVLTHNLMLLAATG